MRDTLKSLASLMSAAFLVQGSNAAITTMIGVATALRGGSQAEVALIAACYSLGFLVGCFLAPPKIQRFGLIRAFTASAAFLTITIIIFEILDGSGGWAAIRFMMGVSVATVLAVSDTWINAKTPGDKRGRVIAIYSTVLGLGSVASQMVFLFLDATSEGFALLFAISMNMAVVFVAMASADAPVVPVRKAGSAKLLTRVAPASGVSAFAAGFIVTSIVRDRKNNRIVRPPQPG